MKNLTIIFLLIILGSCTPRDYLVESDYDPEANFEQYDSYYFTTQARNNDAALFLGDTELKTSVRNEVMGELEAKGYSLESSNPDLLVTFRVFDEDFDMRGYTQENERYWDDEVEVIEYNNIENYNLEAGTLLVNVLDADTKKVIWTGYASGILDGQNFDKSDGAIAAAVERIFDDYNYRANEL